MRLYLFCLFIILITSCNNNTPEPSILEAIPYQEKVALVPQVQNIKLASSRFVINKETVFIVSPEYKNEGKYLKELLEASMGLELKFATKATQNFIRLEALKSKETLATETYSLEIDSTHLAIYGVDAAGVFRGIQTVRQLLPSAFHQKKQHISWALPSLSINDSPAFKWRGMLLDCCRHFFSKEVVKQYIDLLAYYKMNVLHWHLTEDQGWRIAIDKYPKLTEIGAWRKGKEGKAYGGFYSKEDIKEIVAYAQERHIMVVPEIELPGHSQAAIAAYPHLSCTGAQLEVGTKWGVFKDVYCAGNDSTFQFLEAVLTEVIDLFPSEYIHIGGDESPKYRWEHCSKCQRRIKDEKLKDEHELQSYFIQRIATFLESKGKKLVGWDEILEGGLAENAIVQSWRGMGGALTAANQNHYAISSPTSHAYFDYKLDAIDLEKVYSFNPIPKELSTDKHRFILGGECNMWTERVPNPQVLDQKVFPRLLAMAEVLWSAPQQRDYAEFYQRVQTQYPTLDAFGVQYGAETLPIKLETFTSKESINVKLTKGAADLSLHYTQDGSAPTQTSPVYDVTIPLKKNTELSVQAFKKDKAYGAPIQRTFHKHLGNGLVPVLSYEYSSYYTGGGDQAATNGARGSLNFRDGNWQAVQKVPMEITVDLEEVQVISSLSTAFFQKQDSWIFLPTKVDFLVSDDGKKFKLVGSLENSISPKKDASFIESFKLSLENTTARYVRLKAHNITYCPDWHPAAGSEAWLFVDEFVVE
jgi:hexosaminidase